MVHGASHGATGSWGDDAKKDTQIIAQQSKQQAAAEQEALNKRLDAIFEYNKKVRELHADLAKEEMEIRKEEYKDYEKVMRDKERVAEQVAKSISTKFGSAFADIILDGKDFEQSMNDVFQSIIRMIVETITQLLVMKAIKVAVGGPLGLFAAPGSGGGMGSMQAQRVGAPMLNALTNEILTESQSAVKLALAINNLSRRKSRLAV